jgi:hypothetical protein
MGGQKRQMLEIAGQWDRQIDRRLSSSIFFTN